jgi:diguanylate cyclase (GGDEF)-like protein
MNTITDILIVLFLVVLLIFMVYFYIRLRYFKKLSQTDELTGLMNFRGLHLRFEKNINSQQTFSLVLIDIDDFKRFNNKGYSLGDAVLQEFSLFLKNNLPMHSLVTRFRLGDEFIIILNNMSKKEAEQKILDIKRHCLKHDFICLQPFPDYRLSFSEGVVQNSKPNATLEIMIEDAEHSLKKNKNHQIQK